MSQDVIEMEQVIADMVTAAVKAGIENDPRTQQSRAGRIGPSDIGFCRQKVALMTKGVSPTDATDPWAAGVGSAVHAYIERYLRAAYAPEWLVDDTRVEATLPRTGSVIGGKPDLILKDFNAIIDAKTVDGLKTVQTYGPSLSHRYQRHLYAMGAIDAGLLDPNRQVYVGNLYIDISRGGSPEDSKTWVTIEPFDDALTDEIDSWVEDTIYAVRYDEDASRDVAAPVCERFCEFFTACRGALPMRESEPLDDPEIKQAIQMYVSGRTMERDGKQMKDEASAVLKGLNGSDGEWQVRTVEIGAADVPGFTRKASTRLDVRRVRRK